MVLSTDQYNRMLSRITVLETTMNDMVVALSKFVTLSQTNQVLTLLQTDLDDIETRMSALEARVETIENEPLT